MDITQETMRAIGELGQSVKDLTGNNEAAANTLSNLEARARETGEQLDKVTDKSGRLNKDGFEALEKAMGKAGKDYSKQLTLIYKNTDNVISKINDSFGNFAKRIPVIGKTIERGFADVLKRMKSRIDKVLLFSGRMGAGAGAVGGLLGAAGVAAVTLLGRQFNQIEKSSIAVAKATGLSGANLKAVTTSMVAAQNASYAMGISMDETAQATSALVTNLGNFRKITPELIKQTAELAKFTGVGAEEAGKFVGVLTKGFGKSREDIDSFVNGIRSFATREGVNARKVLGDIVSDTNLMSIYMSRGEDALKRAAVQAAKMGMSLAETQGVSEAFLDLEGGAELIGQINMYTGSSLNALEMFNLAAKNDTVAIMNRLNQAFSTPQGIRFIEDMPGLAKQFAGQFGMNLKQLRVAAGLDRERAKVLSADEKLQKSISEELESQQTTFERIKNTTLAAILPPFNDVAEKLAGFVGGLSKGTIQSAVVATAAIGGAALGALLLRGTRLNPMYVQEVGPGIMSRLGKTKIGRPTAAAAKLAGRATAASKGTGFMGRTKGLAKGAGILGKGLARSALRAVPGLGLLYGIYEAYNFASEGKYLAAALALGAGAAGMIPGIGQGASLAISGALGVGSAIAGAAKGAVVGSPRLFMVGEENRKEVIVPTERIRKGLPINAGVARELGSIGVPGYQAGAVMAGAFAARSQAKEQQIQRSQSTVQQGAQSDPAVIRERELAFQRQAQAARDEQRRMMQQIEQKTLQILDEEKKIASNISNPSKEFRRGVGLFQRLSEAAGQYTRKTFNRFAENLRKNNGDLSEALKDTWAQTVGDIENLQKRLLGKLEGMISNLVNKVGNYIADKAGDAVDFILDQGEKAINYLAGGNEANARQITEGVTEIFEDIKTTAVGGYEAALNSTDELALDTLTPLSQGGMTLSPDGTTMVEPPPNFYDKMIAPVKNLTDTVSRAVGNAVRNSQEGFARGREFGRSDSATRGDLDTTGGFFEGGGARVGAALGELEKRLGPLGKGLGTFTRNLDATSVGMVAAGDFAGAATYALKKEVASQALQLGSNQLAGAALADLGIAGQDNPLLAGAANIAQGNYKAAAGDIGLDIGAIGVEKGVNALLGTGAAKSGVLKGLSVGGGVAAAGLGAVGGLMQGDYKMAAKGAAEGAVGYVIGGALTPVLGPLGPIVGGIVAGPVTDGIITTGKELGKGAKNLGKGVGKIFEGDFKGGLGSLAKGGGQILMSGIKGIGSLAKGLGGLVGIGKESKKDKRRKFLKMLMNDLANEKPLVGPGGRMRNKKAQERLLVGLKWGENGPDQALMNEMTAQIMTIAGVPMDIAQAFIFAAAGAPFDDEDLKQLDVEMGTGFANADLSNQFDMSTKKGRRQAYRFLREDGGANISDNLRTVSDASEASAASERERQSAIVRQEIARLAADGLTLEEVRQISGMTGGTGLSSLESGVTNRGIDVSTGNVYLDGVIVGTLVQEDADELKADGLPSAAPRYGDPRGEDRVMA